MYKIETHLHTPYMSNCARLCAEEIVQCYKKAGYSALTVTDHYYLDNLRIMGLDLDTPGDKVEAFLEGYRRVRDVAELEGIKVYYGAELRFFENMNDYLLYGFSPNLLADPQKVCAMSIVDFIHLAREDGALLIQAHPYRAPCVPIPPEYVDGIEVQNRHGTHNNRNELATAYANRHGLLGIGGSDFHDINSHCVGGILSDVLPEDSYGMASLLRSGNFVVL